MLQRLKLELPAQPPPKITRPKLPGDTGSVVKTQKTRALILKHLRLSTSSNPPSRARKAEISARSNLKSQNLAAETFIQHTKRDKTYLSDPMSAEDAYWLGKVDEIYGSDLPCLRIIEEQEDVPLDEDSPISLGDAVQAQATGNPQG